MFAHRVQNKNGKGLLSRLTQDQSVKFDVIFAGLTILVILLMLVVWYTHRNNSTAIFDLTADLIAQVNKTIIQKTSSYLIAAPTMTELSSRVSVDAVNSIIENPELDQIMIEVLRLHPQLSAFFVGNSQGDFLMHSKLADGVIRTKKLNGATKIARMTYFTNAKTREISRPAQEIEDSYDPRKRSWYGGALAERNRFWSDVYIFHTDKVPGITASYPVVNKHGEVEAVFGLDITIAELSEFLSYQQVGQSGVVYIVNKKNEVVAFPDPTIPVVQEAGEFRMRLVDELKSLALQESYRYFRTHKTNDFVIEHNGIRYISSYRPFPQTSARRDWTVAIVVPEDDFIGSIKMTNRLLLFTSFVILTAAMIFAFILVQLKRTLNIQKRFIRDTFGRYLSDDVVDCILESPQGLKLGGEKRKLTIMMTDLRGFTALGEWLPPETVVGMINLYLEVMTDVILKHCGTIDEFIGDAILVIFGAPVAREDDAERAVACALDMQLAMKTVNERNRQNGFPEIEMGIGINTGQLVVGNIGCKKRIKYGVVGKDVNLTSRIESYTVGGQIFVSEATVAACGKEFLQFRNQFEIMPKGVQQPLTIYEINGILGKYQKSLDESDVLPWLKCDPSLAIKFILFDGKHASDEEYVGSICALTKRQLAICSTHDVAPFSNLKITLFDTADRVVTTELYGKVVTGEESDVAAFIVHLTSIPESARTLLDTCNLKANT